MARSPKLAHLHSRMASTPKMAAHERSCTWSQTCQLPTDVQTYPILGVWQRDTLLAHSRQHQVPVSLLGEEKYGSICGVAFNPIG